MNTSVAGSPGTRVAFDKTIGELRPKLHRYCARMTGSAIDGEDVVQDALVKAMEAFPQTTEITNLEGWLFRIAHNAALDHLRRRARQAAVRSEVDLDMIIDPVSTLEDRQVASTSLHTFMRLPLAQRSSVILMDVLGYSLQEISEILGMSVPAVKAALHRGRTHLRELAGDHHDLAPPIMSQSERALLTAYADRFNARDFDAIRSMLAEEVRLELVALTELRGRKEVAKYFHNYCNVYDWLLVPGFVDGRPALLVRNPNDPLGLPTYFIVLGWVNNSVSAIRDFRHARYAIESARFSLAGAG